MCAAPKKDLFEQYARLAQHGGPGVLFEPQPIPYEKNPCVLTPNASQPISVPKDMSTREEMLAALADLREKYKPFLRELAPKIPNYRTRIDLRHFIKDGSEEVTVPFYGGPCGDAVQIFTTKFTLDNFDGKAVYFCCRGADYQTAVLVNGQIAGTHEGFFGAFEFDITRLVHTGENDLHITLENDYIYRGNTRQGLLGDDNCEGDKLYGATGPGYDDPESGWHHCPPGMGLYQDIYIEVRDTCNITDLYVQPDLENSALTLWVEVENATYETRDVSFVMSLYGENFEETVFENKLFNPVFIKGHNRKWDYAWDQYDAAEGENPETVPLKAGHGRHIYRLRIELPNPKVWSLDEPNLYQMQVSLCYNDATTDCQKVTFGMRSFTQDVESAPKGMFYLNGEQIRLRGANTMGFEQQDVLNGDFEQLIDDILLAKVCNMNYWRLTQRPVQDEVYQYCDKLGLLTQTDFPLFGVIRRNKFCEAIRQVEEMMRLIRSHPCNIMISYMNERWTHAADKPHRFMLHEEMERFFDVCDQIVEYTAPGYVIKHCDGDFDPPSDSKMPDIHCYTMWYNGGQLDYGKLYRGFSQACAPGWYYGCGEYGAEGIDYADLMRRRYPAEWIQEPFDPGKILGAQTKAFHNYFYDTPEPTMEAWVEASQAHQEYATKMMTESYRRDPRMISFAIHLYIDAWPAGWMKTIMDCERNPKPAYFAYRKALSPILLTLRSDRFTYYSGENISIETHICNDTNRVLDDGWQVCYELYKDGKVIMTGNKPVQADACTAEYVASCDFTAPEVADREKYTVRAILMDANSQVVSWQDFPVEVFADVTVPENDNIVFIDNLEKGKHEIAGETVEIIDSPLSPVYFLSRKTGHPAVAEFEPMDFRMWYDKSLDRLSPLSSLCFRAEGFTPILTTGSDFEAVLDGADVVPLYAVAEKYYEGKRYIISTVDLRMENPVAKRFLRSLYKG